MAKRLTLYILIGMVLGIVIGAVLHATISDAARLAYPVRDGIPIMLVDEARKLDA